MPAGDSAAGEPNRSGKCTLSGPVRPALLAAAACAGRAAPRRPDHPRSRRSQRCARPMPNTARKPNRTRTPPSPAPPAEQLRDRIPQERTARRRTDGTRPCRSIRSSGDSAPAPGGQLGPRSTNCGRRDRSARAAACAFLGIRHRLKDQSGTVAPAWSRDAFVPPGQDGRPI